MEQVDINKTSAENINPMQEETHDQTQQVKEACLRAGASVVGIAAVDAFAKYAPEGHRPQDVLPKAQSVVVAGVPGPTNGAWRCPDNRLMEISGYDFRENVAVHVVADYIEREHGYYAIQAPGLPVAGQTPPISLMLCAVLAGLGTRSLAANIILNPEYGLLYYAAAITTMPLAHDKPLEKNVCPAPSCVRIFSKLGTTPCIALCSEESGGCLRGEIDQDGQIAHSYFDRERCVSRAMNLGIKRHQKQLEKIINEDDPQKRRNMLYSDEFYRSMSGIARYKESVAQCFECMRVCPVGRKKRKLK